MAPISRKRSRDNKSQNSRKRQRADAAGALSNQPDAPDKAMTLDELPWAEVSLPAGFQDAEGFLGLEEISDVDLVRDSKSGRLDCRVGEYVVIRHDIASANFCR